MRPQEEPPNKRQVKTSRYKLWARGYPPLQKPMTVDDLDDETYGLRTQDAAEVEWTETQIREIVGPDARIDKFRSTMPFVSFWWVSLDEAQLEQVEKLHGVEEIIKDRVVKNVIEVVAVEGPNGARIES